MVSLSRLIVGLVLVLGGLALFIVSLVSFVWGLVYSIPAIILGIFVLFNKSEDKIERRKDLKEKEYKQ